ncbi:MAG: anti-sigma factor family protein [Anaerolineae bacterium]
MIDFLRNLTKSAEVRQQEALNAYLDGALTPRQQRRFEAELARNPALKAELEQRRLIKEQLRQLPRLSVPRSFTLDPAVYGRPQREPLVQLYPALRFATVLTAFFFILAITADLFVVQGGQRSLPLTGAAQDVAMVAATAPAGEPLAEAAAAEEAAAEEAAAEEAGAEIVVESETVEEIQLAEEEHAPIEEPPFEKGFADPGTTTSEAEESALAPAAPAGDMAEGAVPAQEETAALAATQPATAVPTPPPTATRSLLPRPSVETEEMNRAATLSPTAVPSGAEAETVSALPVPSETTPPATARSPLRLVEVGLAAALAVLALVTLIARRRL